MNKENIEEIIEKRIWNLPSIYYFNTE
jgi:hypothetical protein